MTVPSRLRSAQKIAVYCGVLVGLVVFSATVGMRSFQPRTFDFDLVAFYCGGSVTAERLDPYRVEPIRTCEHAIGSVFRKGTKLVVPDPLPPYDQAFFAAVSYVPYGAVRMLWLGLEIGAFSLTAILLARLSGLSLTVVACALVVSDLYCSSLLGQMLPLCLLGIVLTGWALERANGGLVTLGLVLAMAEPHLGLPALVATLAWAGSLRAYALGAGAILVATSSFLPFATTLEYVTAVIPAHALSEINNQEQLSGAYALHVLGIPIAASLAISKILYAIMLAAGVALAPRAASRFGAAAVPFVATAFVLFGGPFLHVTQMAAALPAALLIAGRGKSTLVAAAAAFLAIPWLDYATVLTVLPIAAGAFYVLVRSLWKLDARPAIAVVAPAIASIAAAAIYVALDVDGRVPRYGTVRSTDLAETAWKALVDFDRHGHVVLSALAKLPTELALLAVLGSIAYASFRYNAVMVKVPRPTQRMSLQVRGDEA